MDVTSLYYRLPNISNRDFLISNKIIIKLEKINRYQIDLPLLLYTGHLVPKRVEQDKVITIHYPVYPLVHGLRTRTLTCQRCERLLGTVPQATASSNCQKRVAQRVP